MCKQKKKAGGIVGGGVASYPTSFTCRASRQGSLFSLISSLFCVVPRRARNQGFSNPDLSEKRHRYFGFASGFRQLPVCARFSVMNH